MAKKLRLKDIAEQAGVSITVVSLLLNGRDVRVSDEKRRLILDIARQNHYQPNQIARSLVTQHSHTLGLIVPNIESRFFSSFAKHLELKCRENGYVLFITNSDESSTHDSELVSLLIQRGVDGIFIISSDELSATEEFKQTLLHLSVPYVMVDRTIAGLACDKVYFNNELGGYLATHYLLAHNHRRIAALINADSLTGQRRLNGYKRALQEYGVVFDDSLILPSRYYIEDAYNASHALAHLGATAVFASSDNIALGLLRYLYQTNLRVPRDYSVVSYDNSAADALFEPALTSVEQNVSELAQASFDTMLKRVCVDKHDKSDACDEANACDEDAARAPFDIMLNPVLVEKASVQNL